jgi:prepilin-type N-terminal cleavage/methylation domain-containing protein
MKMPSNKAKVKAFTLIELLVVIFILAVLAALLLPALADRNHKGGSIARCMINQKQIAIGLIMWKSDNGDQFPWKVAITNGGALEAASRGYAAPSFQCLSNYFRMTSIFTCPTDTNRIPAANFAQFRNLNVSYFVSFDAGTNAANNILTGDRNLANANKPLNPGLFVYSHDANMNWTRELHNINQKWTLGVLSFGDSHAEVVKDANLNSFFQHEGLATNRLAIP